MRIEIRMNYLIIGGSKSGKSQIGEEIALNLNKDKVIYVATMKPYDEEDKKRIQLHIKNREGLNFITIEKQSNLQDIVSEISSEDTILIDSITSLLTNEMFLGDKMIMNPSSNVLAGIKKIGDKARNIVIVSDYIFNDAMVYDEITENFKRQLAVINKELVKYCHKVIECSFGNVKYHSKL